MRKRKEFKLLFSQNLIRLRKEAGLSQKRLAELAGLTHNFINDLENMKKGASFQTIDRLSETLDVDLLQFFIDPEYWNNNANKHFLAILDHLNNNINRIFDDYRKKA